jgi:hypothetical protein
MSNDTAKFAIGDKVKWRGNAKCTLPMMVVRYEVDEHGIHTVHVWKYRSRSANYVSAWVGDLVSV